MAAPPVFDGMNEACILVPADAACNIRFGVALYGVRTISGKPAVQAGAWFRWDPACSLSAICQHNSLATLFAAGRRLDLSVPTSWDDTVRSMVSESSV